MNIYRQVDGMRLKRDSATRILGIGNPWWIGKEACGALKIKNHRDALSRLDDDEKDYVGLTDAIGRVQNTIIINESGLYHLIHNSRKKSTQTPKRWVRKDVLPLIRKTGSYSVRPGLIDPTRMTKVEILEMALESEKSRVIEKQGRIE